MRILKRLFVPNTNIFLLKGETISILKMFNCKTSINYYNVLFG